MSQEESGQPDVEEAADSPVTSADMDLLRRVMDCLEDMT